MFYFTECVRLYKLLTNVSSYFNLLEIILFYFWHYYGHVLLKMPLGMLASYSYIHSYYIYLFGQLAHFYWAYSMIFCTLDNGLVVRL